MKHIFCTAIIVFIVNLGFSQTKVTLNTDSTGTKISKHIYGHFAEHLDISANYDYSTTVIHSNPTWVEKQYI